MKTKIGKVLIRRKGEMKTDKEIKCEFCDFKEDYEKMRKIIEDINKRLGVLEG